MKRQIELKILNISESRIIKASHNTVVRYTEAGTTVAHLLSDRKDPGCVLRWPDIPTMPTIVWCAAGHLLFLLYTADVIRIAMGCGIQIHVYADDTQIYVSLRQIYVSCAASDRQPAATHLLACISEIES